MCVTGDVLEPHLEGDDERAHDGAELEVWKRTARKRLELIRRIADGGNEQQTREDEPGHDHPPGANERDNAGMKV